MTSTKTLLKAATIALLAATGLGISGASAQPYWDRYDGRAFNRYEHFDRGFADYRVNRWQVAQTLRFHGLRMIGQPMTFRGRITVRAQDRFGRLVMVHLDRRGDLMRVSRL